MSLIRTWAPYFRSGVRMRGRAYQQANRVRQLPPQEGELLRAVVRGAREYQVTVGGVGGQAQAHCTCSFFAAGQYCKHLWAALLDFHLQASAAHAAAPATEPGGTDAAGLPPAGNAAGRRGQAIGTAAGAVPALPKARKRQASAGGGRRGEPAWVGRLSLLRPPVLGSDAASSSLVLGQRQVCYVVCIEASARYRSLVVELRQRQPTRGGWSRSKPLRISPEDLRELTGDDDREICALLLGAAPVTWSSEDEPARLPRPASVFRLPPAGQRALLARMIATGRCHLDAGVDQPADAGEPATPLAWDDTRADPWVLWMVAADSGDGLSLTCELRRGPERLALDEPALVLSGPAGLVFHRGRVAPLDDRGASRFVSHFRDDLRSRESAAPILVPAHDVDRFLDRLYGLPYLPEIDLPEGVGRREVRLAPAPHLEFDSPGTPVPGETAPERGTVSARLWFGYGERRVEAGEPGRFLSPSGPARPAPLASAGQPSPDDSGLAMSIDEVETDTPAAGDEPEAIEEGPSEQAEGGPPRGLLVRRDHHLEQDAANLLRDLGFRQEQPGAPEVLTLPARQMPAAVQQLLRRGWSVTADKRVLRHAGLPSFSIRSGIDWFELHGGVRYQIQTDDGTRDEVVPLPEILRAARAGRTMVTLGDGSQGLLPEEWLADHSLLVEIGQIGDDHVRYRATQTALLDALLDERELAEVDARFEAARRQLRSFQGVQPLPPGPGFVGELRTYQREGLGWLDFLRQFGLGGILADDMGLGKTVQVLAMLDTLYAGPAAAGGDDAQKPHPTLVVVPRSVVFNWIDEAARFTPRLRVAAYTGAERHGLRDSFAEHDVIVTSYGLMRRDAAELTKHSFEYVILDEAQAIKNPASQGAKAARVLFSRHRLALTGTPVENHLGDLWSIFEFLNPGMLGSAGAFAEMVRGSPNGAPPVDLPPDGAAAESPAGGEETANMNPLVRRASATDRTASAASAQQLAKALRPFILRRNKRQVLQELPEKTEQTILCQMEPAQRQVYDQLLRHYRTSLLGRLEASADSRRGLGQAAFMVLEALLRLRQAACHPGLIDPKRSEEPSAKLEALLEKLADITEEGSKALVFSQFTSMLAIVRQRLDAAGVAYEYLDGQTRHRRRHVQRFQTDPACRVFLISLKAGGLGLNLTAAEYVFILDPWWNPAVEAQAIDRAHRIGQTRHVFAYRLICQDTVEQRIAHLQERKKQLADAIIGQQENLLRSLTREDLELLLT